MKYFLRFLLLSLRYKWSLLASVVTALCIAVFWGASISAVYPLVEVVFEGKTIQLWIDEAITDADQRSDKLREEIADLKRQERQATGEEKMLLDSQIALREGHVEAQDKVIASYRSFQPFVDRWAPKTPFSTLAAVMGLLILATCLKGVCLVMNTVLVARVGAATVADLRRMCFGKLLRMDQQRIDNIGNSRLQTMFMQNAQLMQAGLQAIYGKSVREPLKAVACLVAASWISWQLLLASFVLAPFGAVLIHHLGKRMKGAAGRELKGFTAVFQTLSETIGGIRIVRIFTRERAERHRFKVDVRSVYKMRVRVAFYDSLLRPITELLAITTMAIAILVGAYLVLNQETHLFGLRMSSRPLKPSEMIMFFAMLAGISDPARKIGDIYNVLVRAAMGSKAMFQMFEAPPKVSAPSKPLPAPLHSKSIRLENVQFGYTRKSIVLRNVTLEIPFGQTIAIVGANGSGKSTLVNLIARFYDPWKGEVFLDQVKLRDIRPRQLRKQIGIVTQDSYLFGDTVWNNIRYGGPTATDDEVIEAARLAGVMQFIDELPNGLETNVGNGGKFLSGGQRQRVALARAILSDPRILILDEPTSQVDPQTEQVFRQAIGTFLKGRTTLLITHKAATLALADRLVVMKSGRIVEDVLVTSATSSPEQFSRLLAKAG